MSHVLKLPAGSQEFVQVRVRVDRDAVDPTGYDVEFAWMPRGIAPGATDWEPAEWAPGGPPFYARELVTGSVSTLMLWVRVDTGTELVVRPAGLVTFFGAAPDEESS